VRSIKVHKPLSFIGWTYKKLASSIGITLFGTATLFSMVYQDPLPFVLGRVRLVDGFTAACAAMTNAD